jgi:predicted transcriptional regulator of viral defense system
VVAAVLVAGSEKAAAHRLAPGGTFSHETALSLLGLSDIIPTAIHFTIPESSRLGRRAGIRLHRSRHRANQDRTLRDGLWVNTARRALLDSARIGADPDQLLDAARGAKERAMLTSDDIARLREHPR